MGAIASDNCPPKSYVQLNGSSYLTYLFIDDCVVWGIVDIISFDSYLTRLLIDKACQQDPDKEPSL